MVDLQRMYDRLSGVVCTAVISAGSLVCGEADTVHAGDLVWVKTSAQPWFPALVSHVVFNKQVTIAVLLHRVSQTRYVPYTNGFFSSCRNVKKR